MTRPIMLKCIAAKADCHIHIHELRELLNSIENHINSSQGTLEDHRTRAKSLCDLDKLQKAGNMLTRHLITLATLGQIRDEQTG